MAILFSKATNYLKVLVTVTVPTSGVKAKDARFFFFDDRDAEETREKFEEAVAFSAANGGSLSVFKRPPFGGPWDYVRVVGENPAPAHEA